MKRSLVAALVVGALVSALVIAAHATRLLVPLDEAILNLLPARSGPASAVSVKLLYPLIFLLAFGVAWLVVLSRHRQRLAWPVAILVFEAFLVSWVCLLFNFALPPFGPVAALVLGFLIAGGYAAFRDRSRSGLARTYFRGRVSREQFNQISSGELPFAAEARSYETTAVVCDIANKHELAEECEPALLARITEEFIRTATASFLKAGAYIETVTGEGIVALFGFPAADEQQAEKATRHALALLESFESARADAKDEVWKKINVHLGISSGTTIISPLAKDDRPELLAAGEPVELARRFCVANRFYGSRVLIGPRTFEMASASVVARPIDFLSGVDVRERHEIYEPLRLASEASQEEIARRDAFWNGVVLYREKRWAEAYSQFQRARGPNDQDDAPLQLYLRRLEPLALHLVESFEE